MWLKTPADAIGNCLYGDKLQTEYWIGDKLCVILLLCRLTVAARSGSEI